MRKTLRLFAGFLIAVSLALGVPANLCAQASLKRGTPQREGRGWVERATCEVPARGGGRLVVRTDSGSVRVRPGALDRMECQVRLRAYQPNEEEARRLFTSYVLSLRMLEGNGILLAGESTRATRHHGGLSVEYQLTVPLKFNLDLETQGGDLDVGNLDGELRGETAGGDIRTGDVTGPVRVETAGGDIAMGQIGRRVEARTAGGSIRLTDVQGDAVLETSGGEIVAGTIAGSMHAQTAGGDIVLRGASGPVRAETAGGQIQIGPCGDTVRAETAGGSIRLHGARGMVQAETAGGSIDLFQMQSAVRAETAAGPILAEFNNLGDSFAASQLETSVGDVRVFLPPDLSLNIDAAIEQAFGHKIVSDFPIQVQGEEENFRHRSQRAEAALNGGGKVLRIRTSMGNIEIHKLDPRVLEELKALQEGFWKVWQERRQQRMEDGGKHDE